MIGIASNASLIQFRPTAWKANQVYLGDSLTKSTSYVSFIQALLPNNSFAVNNIAHDGWQTTDVISDLPTHAAPLMPDMTGIATVSFLLIGDNDLANNVTAATAWNNIQTICAYLRTHGSKVLLCKIPYNAALNSGQNTARGTLNTSIGGGLASVCDALSDLDSAMPQAANGIWTGDGTHWNDAGSTVAANCTYMAVNASGIVSR